jgi:hypothetical protein
MDSAQKNIPGYKSSFTKNSTKKDFVKRTPFKIVNGLSDENLASRGMKRTPYPTPKKSVK